MFSAQGYAKLLHYLVMRSGGCPRVSLELIEKRHISGQAKQHSHPGVLGTVWDYNRRSYGAHHWVDAVIHFRFESVDADVTEAGGGAPP